MKLKLLYRCLCAISVVISCPCSMYGGWADYAGMLTELQLLGRLLMGWTVMTGLRLVILMMILITIMRMRMVRQSLTLMIGDQIPTIPR